MSPATQPALRKHSAFDAIVGESEPVEKLAGDFQFTEGPVWFREGYLIFSDIPANTIYRWTPDGSVSVFRKASGYDGSDAPEGAFIGSNGMTRDANGRLVICEHGNARITRLEPDGSVTVLADRFEGKRLNSPNDLVYRSDGSLYFTDPPYGLAGQDDDPKKELPFNGVYRLHEGRLQLLLDGLTRPNGLAFSPDERYLYVGNSDPARKIWMRYEVTCEGALVNGVLFCDATADPADGLPDGLKIDTEGNILATGPGGVWVFAPDGQHLGCIRVPETPSNLQWGGDEGKTLYITAQTGVYRTRVLTGGRVL